jgi:hypothetical protein
MVYELTLQGEPERPWWPSSKTICINSGLRPESPSGIDDTGDGLRAYRGLVWGLVFELGIAFAGVLCWELWVSFES